MDLKEELKQLIINTLELEDVAVSDISDSEPLFGEGLGLDSIDALELGMAIKRKYNISTRRLLLRMRLFLRMWNLTALTQ